MNGSRPSDPMLCRALWQQSRLPDQIETFQALSRALGLSQAEECTLLDITAQELASLRLSMAAAAGMDMAKLHRRVDYAISILRRMLAASLP